MKNINDKNTKMHLLNGKYLAIAWCSVILMGCVKFGSGNRCSRVPERLKTERTPSTGHFRIRLSETSGRYKPGRQYTIWLESTNAHAHYRERKRHTFTGFFLAVERKGNGTTTSDLTEDFYSSMHGTLEIVEGDTLTKLECGNLVTHTHSRPKTEIQVLWTAPDRGNGCVVFRATVIEHPDVWYKDEGPLSKEFCEDEDEDEDKDFYSSALEKCCACEEAKYELTFERLWSRNTHPKDFPNNAYTTRFSDIIGATHKNGYCFWRNGEAASEGLKEVAELGATKKLESELKDKSDEIRTIIKARGLAYPNITGKTFAVFRVDSDHHLLSLVSMIFPSPDWFVGVSGLELCQTDCKWIERKEVELYPWDAGTDGGTSYMSPDQESRPPDYIRRISSQSPNNNLSPFYDPSGLRMKPLAKLTLLRQRLYAKDCSEDTALSGGGGSRNNANSGGGSTKRVSCDYGEWGRWGPCQPKCGDGTQYRQRYLRNNDVMNKQCNEVSFDTRDCHTDCEEEQVTEPSLYSDEQCPLGDWSEWSPCTQSCGEEYQTASKSFTKNRKKCKARYSNTPTRRRSCQHPSCVGNISQSEFPLLNCTQYKNTVCETECDAPCGVGRCMRPRIPVDEGCGKLEPEEVTCNEEPCRIPKYCYRLPKIDRRTCTEVKEAINKYYYNMDARRCEVFTTNCAPAENEFELLQECLTNCTGLTEFGRELQEARGSL